jgi:voltage-gated potassium channel
MLLSRLKSMFRTLKRERFFLIAPVTLGVIFASALAVYFFEYSISDASIRSLWDGVWWAFVTICTVGYGDKFPVSDGGRIIGILLMISGIGLLSMLTATVASVMVEQKIKEGKGLESIKRKDHVVICGWNGNSEEVLAGLLRNQAVKNAIVLVNELQVDEIDLLKLRYDQYGMIFLRGDFVQEEVLLRADIRKAKIVLIMADLSGLHPKERTDDRTILAALTAKSLAPQVKVIAELTDSENRIHLKRANIDEIVVRGEHIGSLLAGAVGSPGLPRVFSRLLSQEEASKLIRQDIPHAYVGRTFGELSVHFRKQDGAILIGILKEKKPVRLEDVLSDDASAIDRFIRERLRESKKDFSHREDNIKIILNPEDGYLIGPEDHAVALTGR